MSYCAEHGIPHSAFLDWLPEDRAKLIAHLLEDAERCSLCGTASWEWDENQYAYEVAEKFCKGCYQKSVSSDDRSTLPGTTMVLVPNTDEHQIAQAKMARRLRELDNDGGSDE